MRNRIKVKLETETIKAVIYFSVAYCNNKVVIYIYCVCHKQSTFYFMSVTYYCSCLLSEHIFAFCQT